MSIRNLFDALKRGQARAPARQARRGDARLRPATGRLDVQALEDRCVPAVVFSVGSATLLEGNAGTQYAAVVVSLTEPRSSSVTVN